MDFLNTNHFTFNYFSPALARRRMRNASRRISTCPPVVLPSATFSLRRFTASSVGAVDQSLTIDHPITSSGLEPLRQPDDSYVGIDRSSLAKHPPVKNPFPVFPLTDEKVSLSADAQIHFLAHYCGYYPTVCRRCCGAAACWRLQRRRPRYPLTALLPL